FANFFGFEPQACNAYSGNEKGNVENKVGYIRYNFITPAPSIIDLGYLERLLEEHLTNDRQRIHYVKGRSIQELLEEEYQYLWALPVENYTFYKVVKVKALNFGDVDIVILRNINTIGYM